MNELDVKFFVDLLDKYNLDFYEVMDTTDCHFLADGKIDFNALSKEVVSSIVNNAIADKNHQDEDIGYESEGYF